MANFLKKLFGSKDERDIRQLTPTLKACLAQYERIDKLSDDELRAASAALRKKIADYIAPEEAQVADIRAKLEDVEIEVSAKEKLATYYNSLGISASNTQLTFTQDGQFSGKVDGKSISGTYTYDPQKCLITMKTLLFSLPAYAKKTTGGMSILFESKKLLNVLQTISAISGNTTLSTIGDLSKNYDGIRLGFDMAR
jgi:predicted transcriptional regulator